MNGSNKGLFSHHKKEKEVLKDNQYLNELKTMTLNCIVCGSSDTELHHVYSVLHGIKRSDRRVIALCTDHHRGEKCSPHGGRKAFSELFSLGEQIEIADYLYKKYEEEKNYKNLILSNKN